MMSPMRSLAVRPFLSPVARGLAVGVATVVAAVVAFGAVRPADAAKPPKKYFFEVADVKASDSLGQVGKDLLPTTSAQIAKSIAGHPQLVAALDGAPDPKVNAKAFKKWLTKKKIAGAYRVNVELTSFEEELEEKDDSLNKEKRLIVRLGLRTFGETIPERVMGFSGEGSATVKLDVGKKLRPRDREYAIAQALELAMTDALASSLTKLANPPPPPPKK